MAPDLASLARETGSDDVAVRTRAAARLMSLLEAEPHRLVELRTLAPEDGWPRPRLVLGVTGAPGSGKSTLVDALVRVLREGDGDRRIGVVAVDPSSPFTGGAVLGDRVRMMRHATDPAVFIRSLATRGHLGGLSLGVKGVLQVLGMVGCDVVLVETVGVGQSEVEVARVADLVAVVLAPGAGDSVQMLKAGLLEVGDLFVVNKGDLEGADALERNLLQALERAAATGRRPGSAGARTEDAGPAPGQDGPTPALPVDEWPVVARVSAARGTGIDELVETLEALTRTHGSRWRAARRDRLRTDAREALLDAARRRIRGALAADPTMVERVLEGRIGVDAAAAELLARMPRDPDGDPA